MFSKTCKKCNKEFFKNKRRSLFNWNRQKFCSSECSQSSPKTKGLTHSEETKRKLSEINMGRLSHGWKPESREKARLAKLGKKLSEEHKKAIGLAHTGNKSWRWIEDRTKIVGKHTRSFHDSDYKQWVLNVRNRDGWKCKISDSNCSGRLETHHILGWKSHPELRYQINNGITLCHFHHPRKREDEKRLSPYFMELVSVSKE